jgi:hypothetical protein
LQGLRWDASEDRKSAEGIKKIPKSYEKRESKEGILD